MYHISACSALVHRGLKYNKYNDFTIRDLLYNVPQSGRATVSFNVLLELLFLLLKWRKRHPDVHSPLSIGWWRHSGLIISVSWSALQCIRDMLFNQVTVVSNSFHKVRVCSRWTGTSRTDTCMRHTHIRYYRWKYIRLVIYFQVCLQMYHVYPI